MVVSDISDRSEEPQRRGPELVTCGRKEKPSCGLYPERRVSPRNSVVSRSSQRCEKCGKIRCGALLGFDIYPYPTLL